MIDFTTVIGVDLNTLKQLYLTHRTWMHTEIYDNPLIVFYDDSQVHPSWLSFLQHPDCTLINWPPSGCEYDTQRERMLSGFLHVAARFVKTSWWLKLDTDAVRVGTEKWIKEEWFEPLEDGGYNAFIGNRWGYTKPAGQMAELDNWGDNVPGLAHHPRLNLPYDPAGKTCRHPGGRLASWITFFNTEWNWTVADYCLFGHMPVPSEDGFHFYCAKRRNDPYVLTKFKKFGWTNVPRFNKLFKKVNEVLFG